MAVCSKEEVFQFLFAVKAKLLLDQVNNLHIWNRNDRKNENCMLELGLCHNDVADIILKLEIDNYSETQECTIYKGEKIWIFGYDYHSYELYIKLRLRKKVICISFHEKEYEINYPYCGGGK